MQVLTSLSGLQISAASASFAPTNSADVSAIASAYQVVTATAMQKYAGTAFVTSVNDNPLSASRAGQAANASLANSAYYDGTGRLISALPDSAAVSAIASSYAESAASGKQDSLTFAYNADSAISSINGSALAGGEQVVSSTGTNTSGPITYIDKINDLTISAKVTYSARSAMYASVDGYGRSISACITSVSANSAAWDAKLDSSAFNSADFYSTSNPSSFITGVDLSPYQTTAGMSGYIPTSMSSDFQQVTGMSSYVSYSSIGYNTASAISGINGSALAGTTYSAGTGIDITDDVISVEAPVDIVAGPGIVIDNPDGNTLRVSQQYPTDETVLFEDLTTDGTVVASVVLSETSTNFEEIEITVGWKGGSTSVSAPGRIIFKCKPDGRYYGFGGLVGCDNSSHFVLGGIGTSGTTLALKNVIDLYSVNLSSITPQSFNNILRVYKVVGIHRIANN